MVTCLRRWNLGITTVSVQRRLNENAARRHTEMPHLQRKHATAKRNLHCDPMALCHPIHDIHYNVATCVRKYALHRWSASRIRATTIVTDWLKRTLDGVYSCKRKNQQAKEHHGGEEKAISPHGDIRDLPYSVTRASRSGG